ncbi:MAG TPA: xanthine dehydrogenase family protein subunit M [Nitrososphaeria archaeon]|nr:xanthine dehydrogenase family protein subunit M [Nitrososphaeria archaeon]
MSTLIFRTTLPTFEYLRPNSLEEALELKAKYGGDAMILAGGTDLLVDIRMGAKKPKYVIDIKGIKEVSELKYVEGKGLEIGSAVTLSEIERSKIVREKFHVLWDAVRRLADFSLRTRATLAGNIANASPASDSAPALLVLGAEVELSSTRGTRKLPIKKFFKWVKQTYMEPDEILTRIFVPEPPKDSKGMYLKFTRITVEDLSVVGIAGLTANLREPEKRIVRLAYASVAPTPILVEEVEEIFKRDRPIKELIREAVEAVKKKTSPITDVRGTAEYRRHLIEFGTAYLLNKLLGVME